MILFGKKQDINSAIKEYRRSQNPVLIDVREGDEYRRGHIAGAINVPMSVLVTKINKVVFDKDREIYLYCLSGVRSRKAADILRSLDYTQVKEIGALKDYRGVLEK